MNQIVLCLLALVTLAACVPSSSNATPQIVTVYAASAAQPWLDELYVCAEESSVLVNLSPDAPEISIRLGEPAGLSTPAFQIGTEELVIAANQQSPLGSLTVEAAQALFAGQGNPSVQVWVYASGEDLQGLFDQLVMNGRRVAPNARLAVSPSHMIEALTADANAVGFLPRRWIPDGLRDLLVIPGIPVLAVTSVEPQGVVRDLIACVQK